MPFFDFNEETYVVFPEFINWLVNLFVSQSLAGTFHGYHGALYWGKGATPAASLSFCQNHVPMVVR